MNNRKNQNSILVLATLGVYLGLVLVGATPHVLAQAAMSRQFDIRDEVEVKDDLDNEPNDSFTDITESVVSEIDQKITQSVGRFLAKFKSVDSIGPFTTSPNTNNEAQIRQVCIDTASRHYDGNVQIPFRRNVTITNLPRAGLGPLLASDAK